MQAGRLNVRATLESPTEVSDGMGGGDVIWTTRDTVWASVMPLSGREAWKTQAAIPTASHMIIIRYRTDINAGWRLVVNGKAYRIVAPPKDVNWEHERLELTCEVQDAGTP